tara:strand:+ start:548 stop:772 length:225 start_codon:yes stop_codon:yes gene_type:complete
MKKSDMVKAIMNEEKNAWNAMVRLQHKFGVDSQKYKDARERWGGLASLVSKLELTEERKKIISLYKMPDQCISI